mgnify:CR=1 FL=1
MTFGIVSDLVRHSLFEKKCPSVLQFCLHFTVETQYDMTFVAPVVGRVIALIRVLVLDFLYVDRRDACIHIPLLKYSFAIYSCNRTMIAMKVTGT